MEVRLAGAGRPREAFCLAADSVGKQGPGKGETEGALEPCLGTESRWGWNVQLDLEPDMCSHFMQESQSSQREAWLGLR